MPTIRACPNPVMRDAYLQLVHARSGVEERCCSRSSAAPAAGSGADLPAGRPRAPTPCSASTDGVRSITILRDRPRTAPVGEILRGCRRRRSSCACCCCPETSSGSSTRLGPDQLPDAGARELFRAVVLAREPERRGHPPALSMSALMACARPRDGVRPGPSRRPPAPRPEPARLSEADLAYESSA